MFVQLYKGVQSVLNEEGEIAKLADAKLIISELESECVKSEFAVFRSVNLTDLCLLRSTSC